MRRIARPLREAIARPRPARARRLARAAAATVLAVAVLPVGAGLAVACTTVVGQLEELPPRFSVAFIGRVVGVDRSSATRYPVGYAVQVETVIYGPMSPGPHHFNVGDPCRPAGAPPAYRVLWAMADPGDMSEWTTLAWRVARDGSVHLLSPWHEQYPFPRQMSRQELDRFLLASGAPPATSAAPPGPVAAPPGGMTGILVPAAFVAGLVLALGRRPGRRSRRRATLHA